MATMNENETTSIICKDLPIYGHHSDPEWRINFTLKPGEIGVLLDQDAFSTVIKLMLGWELYEHGKLTVFDESWRPRIKSQLPLSFHARIGHGGSNWGLLSHMSIRENIRLPTLFYQDLEIDEQYAAADHQLRSWSIPNSYWDRPPSKVSPDIYKMSLLARAVVCSPDLMLLENPNLNLSSEQTLTLINWLDHQKESGRSILIYTSNSILAAAIGDWFCQPSTGKLTKNPQEIFDSVWCEQGKKILEKSQKEHN
ncbi:MAG: hypothetical protein CMP10_20140 [Zetaproteobacteria bacterium]|nr:hypothetical protein [Pseudobdellovibrionaceae bacterium]